MEAYKEILQVCKSIEIPYSDMLRLTLSDIEALGEVVYKRKVQDINEKLNIAYQEALMIGIAQNNPKKFPKSAPTVKEKQTKPKLADPEAIYNMLTTIAGSFSSDKEKPTG